MKGNNHLLIALCFIFACLSFVAGVTAYLLMSHINKDLFIIGLLLGILFLFLGFRLQVKKLALALTQSQAQLIRQEKMAQVGLLTAGIAHEIKNPLNFVNNFSRLTKELIGELKEVIQASFPTQGEATPHTEEINEILQDIDTNLDTLLTHGMRAESIVQNMLAQTRKTQAEKTPTNVNDLLTEYLNLAYHGMRAQNSEFNIKIEKDLSPHLPDIPLLQQPIGRVFLNILNNAMYAAFHKKQFAQPNFMPTVSVQTNQEKDFIKIIIRDNGPGIEKAKQDKIFEPFYTTKPVEEGTGLGLSICHDIIIKQHHGKILVESVLENYTEFQIYLPIQSTNTSKNLNPSFPENHANHRGTK